MTKRACFDALCFDEQAYQRYYHRHQIAYIRTRLRCVKLFSEGGDFASIAAKLGLGERSVRNSVNLYISKGFSGLVSRVKRKQPTLLSAEQEQAFKQTILHTHPTEHGFESNIWTGQVMVEYIQKTYQVVYKTGIYNLLERLNLSHQRAHADYTNADKAAQARFLNNFKETLYAEPPSTAIVFADEFSVCEKPTCYYGWGEKNTRPSVKTDEKKVNE